MVSPMEVPYEDFCPSLQEGESVSEKKDKPNPGDQLLLSRGKEDYKDKKRSAVEISTEL